MARTLAKDGRVYISIRLDPDLVRRLEQEATDRLVSRNFLIEKAVGAWLEEHEGAA